jgi:hypothetical protein
MSYERDDRDLLTIFKDGVGKGLRVLNIRSKEAYDALRIKSSMRQLERRKRQAIYDMGATLYRTYKYTGKVVEDTVAATSAARDRALAKPKVATLCDCGTEINEGAKYCPECLKKLD